MQWMVLCTCTKNIIMFYYTYQQKTSYFFAFGSDHHGSSSSSSTLLLLLLLFPPRSFMLILVGASTRGCPFFISKSICEDIHPMAIIFTDHIPLQQVRTQLKQALAARPPSPLHSCAPSLSGAQKPTQQLEIETHKAHIQSFDANCEKNPTQWLTRFSNGSFSNFRWSLIMRRFTSNEQHTLQAHPKQHTSAAKKAWGHLLSP